MANFLKALIPLLSSIALLLHLRLLRPATDGPNLPRRRPLSVGHHLPPPHQNRRFRQPTAQQRRPSIVHHPGPILRSRSAGGLRNHLKVYHNARQRQPGRRPRLLHRPRRHHHPSGHSGGNFGVFNSSSDVNPSVFAIEFDTYVNSMDPNYRHVGIDIEYMKSSNTTEVDDAILRQVVTARIDYEEASKLISVVVYAGSKTYEVSYVYDLSTVLNQQVQVGLAASTGGAVAIHDVVSWYFTATLVHTTANAEMKDAKIRQYV